MGKTLKVDYSPPADLSEASQQLWSQLVPDRAKSQGRLTLIHEALRARDAADAAAEVLKREGMTTKTKTTGAVHLHPLVKVEKEQRALFVRCWRALSFEWDGRVDGSKW